jgi:hypothetical protein
LETPRRICCQLDSVEGDSRELVATSQLKTSDHEFGVISSASYVNRLGTDLRGQGAWLHGD